MFIRCRLSYLFSIIVALLVLHPGITGAAEQKQAPDARELTLLKERAGRYWEAKLKRDFKTQYEFLEPRVRGRMPLEDFVKGKGVVEYLQAHVEDAQVSGNFAIVTTRLKVQFHHPMLKPTPPPEETEVREQWVQVAGVWYLTLEKVPAPPTGKAAEGPASSGPFGDH